MKLPELIACRLSTRAIISEEDHKKKNEVLLGYCLSRRLQLEPSLGFDSSLPLVRMSPDW